MTANDDATNGARDVCGSTDTASGEPCRNSVESCPWHDPNADEDDVPETGRPSKLSHARQERIAQILEGGGSFEVACASAGIAPRTGHRWMRRGEEQDEGKFAQFRQRVLRARGHGKVELATSVIEIAKEKGDAATLLRYLRYIEAGEESQEDDALAGLNLVVPDVAHRDGEE